MWKLSYKKIVCIIIVLICFCSSIFSQKLSSEYPLNNYDELTIQSFKIDSKKWENAKLMSYGLEWGSIDVRYSKHDLPNLKGKRNKLTGWRGERISAQAILYTKINLENVVVNTSNLRNNHNIISKNKINSHFVRYVMADEFKSGDKGGCAAREDKTEWDSLLVADVLDIVDRIDVKAYSVQPVWFTIDIPEDIPHGKYTGTVTVSGSNFKQMNLSIDVEVIDRTLKKPSEWDFCLDLWQNPYSVARYYQVPLWSIEHFDAMRPLMKMLANAGQKFITASIMHKPWNGQTEDHYDSMVTKVKKIDGTWEYKYSVFDRWVEFMLNDVGIDGMISCYTLIPWNLSFDYYDEATNRMQFIKAGPTDSEYSEYWIPFLKDFAAHLREKGWFERTMISMDERALDDMIKAIEIIKIADPNFKISLAGNYHGEIENDLFYLTIPYGNEFPIDIKNKRDENSMISSVYTCCVEQFPNMFTFSPSYESAWTAIYSLANGFDGYLRWAVNSWPIDPLRDSRFRTWAAGDTYSIYPGPRSSIRFERLIEGIQACEKIKYLKELFIQNGNNRKMTELNNLLNRFTPEGLKESGKTPDKVLNDLYVFLNSK